MHSRCLIVLILAIVLVCGRWTLAAAEDEDPNFICGMDSVSAMNSSSTGEIPPNDTTKVLLVFCKFKNERACAANSCWSTQWSDTSGLPLWKNNILRDSVGVYAATDTSLSNFFRVSSNGKHIVWGHYHPSLVRTLHNSSYYYVADSTDYGGLRNLVQELVNTIDDSVDWKDYDEDGDAVVDQVFFLFRGCTGFPWGWDGMGHLGMGTITTHDSTASDVPITLNAGLPGSGVICKGASLAWARSDLAHEYCHNLFAPLGAHAFPHDVTDSTMLHLRYEDALGLMDDSGHGIAMSGFERYWLGWVSPQVISSTTNNVLIEDALTTGDIYKAYVAAADSNQYFLFENRQRTSVFEQLPYPGQCQWELPAPGLVIYHVDKRSPITGSSLRHSVDVETADGLRYNWSPPLIDPQEGQDSLDLNDTDERSRAHADDVWTPKNGSTFATYTSPNTSGYGAAPTYKQIVRSGLCVNNIRYDSTGVNMLANFVFADTSLHNRITADVKWSGHMDLSGDVSIGNNATLSAAPGTKVRVRANYDNQASGSSSTETEIIVRDDGAMNIQGTSDSLVTFASAAATPDSADWFGINVLGGGDIYLSHCDVAHGEYGVYSDDADPATFTVHKSAFHRNHYHGLKVRARQGTFRVDSCRVYENGYSGVYIQKKKGLTANPLVKTYLTADSVYSNSTVTASFDVELIDYGGNGGMRDTLKYNTLGPPSDSGPTMYGGVYIGGDYDGAHISYLFKNTARHYPQGYGMCFVGMTANVHKDSLEADWVGVYGFLSTVGVDSTHFAGSNATHVWNDTLSSMCLGDEGNSIPGGNAFHLVPDSLMIQNYDGSSLTAENNWWDNGSCAAPPAAFFYGPVDSMPRLCDEPSLSRPGIGWSGGGEKEEGAPAVVRLSALPNPGRQATTLQYEVPGQSGAVRNVELAIYDVSGRRVDVLVHRSQEPGTYRLDWRRAPTCGSGLYFARLTVDDVVTSTKIVVSR